LGVLAMLAMIVLMDQLVWRPVVAWSQKFTDEETSAGADSWFWEWFRRSNVWRALSAWFSAARPRRSAGRQPSRLEAGPRRGYPVWRWAKYLAVTLLAAGALFGLLKYVHLLTTLSANDWIHLVRSTAATFLRVVAAVALASLWTVPVGVMIGRHPQWS